MKTSKKVRLARNLNGERMAVNPRDWNDYCRSEAAGEPPCDALPCKDPASDGDEDNKSQDTGFHCQALDQFDNFMIFLGNSKPNELPEAAQMDVAVINLRMMSSTSSLGGSEEHANRAAEALRIFLARWPTSFYATAAKTKLKELESWLSRPR